MEAFRLLLYITAFTDEPQPAAAKKPHQLGRVGVCSNLQACLDALRKLEIRTKLSSSKPFAAINITNMSTCWALAKPNLSMSKNAVAYIRVASFVFTNPCSLCHPKRQPFEQTALPYVNVLDLQLSMILTHCSGPCCQRKQKQD